MKGIFITVLVASLLLVAACQKTTEIVSKTSPTAEKETGQAPSKAMIEKTDVSDDELNQLNNDLNSLEEETDDTPESDLDLGI